MQDLEMVLKHLKEIKHLSNEECAELCGISLTSWKKLITGRMKNPSWNMMKLISAGFDVPLDYLADIRNEKMLTPQEFDHMQMYRSLPYDVQNGIKAIVVERYDYWLKQYREHKDYELRLKFRKKCSKLPISKIRQLLKELE